MKIRGSLAALAVAALVVGIVAPASVAAPKKKSGPVVVGTDDPADWGANVDPTIAPAGAPLGMELVEASIEMADTATMNFVIKIGGLPPSGGIPEFVRYGWDFTVDGEMFQLAGGFTELLRGMCNPLVTDPACPPAVGDPATLTDGPFFLRQGACTVQAACAVLAIFNATFDAASSTITIPITLETVGAKPGSKIAAGAGPYGPGLYAAPGALVTYASLPMDTLMVTKTFVVPKK